MNDESSLWPPLSAENRPWTRWWWMGCVVDREHISRLLETYRDAGFGGVEITSIYGVRGEEARSIAYLSPEWVAMVRHAVGEAARLGMLVDLTPGSGWRIGGDYLTDRAAAAKLALEPTGEAGSPAGYRAECRLTGELVKRAGPGGTGRTFNPFSREALEEVIDHLGPHYAGLGIRAQFHDSWEYDSDWSLDFLDRFAALRGYDLRDHLAALAGEGNAERIARVRYDARLTLAELALTAFIVPWSEWCHRLGQLSRNQAHGSPGNLLDLYAAADIPETEIFSSAPTGETPLISKFASSAANVAGRRIVSSETGTWLDEHFHVTLAALKHLADNLFVSGINHHVYHGTAYSPPDAPWPGRLFYASTQLNPQNTIWRDLPAFNAYLARCQSMLQNGSPDNDLLLYFPFHDVIHDPRRKLAQKLVIMGEWLKELAAVDTYRLLWRRGYSFDYVSDLQLEGAGVEGGAIVTPGGRYRALLVPPCRYLPVETLERLIELSSRGGRVLFIEPAPSDVPGFAEVDERRLRFEALMKGAVRRSDVGAALAEIGVRREPLVDLPGVLFVRRSNGEAHDYFVANQGPDPVDAWIELSVEYASVAIMDPLSGRVGRAALRRRGAVDELRLQLDPGGSLFLRASADDPVSDAWPYTAPGARAFALEGPWSVEFIEGGPVLPPGYTTRRLESWTGHGGDAERFAGTARYRVTFDSPDSPDSPLLKGDWLLDLGTVHSSARIRLNGGDEVVLIGPTFRTPLCDVKPEGNLLEIEVTNLAANRIRDLDRHGVEWKIFGDINIVDRTYRPLDASGWEVVASGLLGPVRLVPLEAP